MSPDQFDGMGLDVHCCLRTFQLHPATALALPLRPAHVKSAMRLRKAPFSSRPPPPSPQKQAVFVPNKNTNTCGRGKNGNSTRSNNSAEGAVAAAAAGGFGAAGRTADVRGVTGCDGARPVVCANVQHFSWILLTSACLSKVSSLRTPCVSLLCVSWAGGEDATTFFDLPENVPSVMNSGDTIWTASHATPSLYFVSLHVGSLRRLYFCHPYKPMK